MTKKQKIGLAAAIVTLVVAVVIFAMGVNKMGKFDLSTQETIDAIMNDSEKFMDFGIASAYVVYTLPIIIVAFIFCFKRNSKGFAIALLVLMILMIFVSDSPEIFGCIVSVVLLIVYLSTKDAPKVVVGSDQDEELRKKVLEIVKQNGVYVPQDKEKQKSLTDSVMGTVFGNIEDKK